MANVKHYTVRVYLNAPTAFNSHEYVDGVGPELATVIQGLRSCVCQAAKFHEGLRQHVDSSNLADDAYTAFENGCFSVWINDQFVFKPTSLLHDHIPTGSIVSVKPTTKDTLPWSSSNKFECVKMTDQNKMTVQKPFVVISTCARSVHEAANVLADSVDEPLALEAAQQAAHNLDFWLSQLQKMMANMKRTVPYK